MSFRIEEKLFLKPENILQFREFLISKSAKKLYSKRIINSLYFDNINRDMYRDSIEGSVPRKKIRVRNYPGTEDQNYYLEIKTSSVEGRFKTKNKITKMILKNSKRQEFLIILMELVYLFTLVMREYIKIQDVKFQ